MKNIAFLLFIVPFCSFAQLNITQLGYVDYQALHGTGTANLWGYTDEFGNEYAIVGANNGVSIVDVTNPASPNEVFFEPGSTSIWREVKTYNNFAYITTEETDGLMVIDLNPLPASTALTVTYFNGPLSNPWQSAHSLFIDENGILYIHGANRGNGGVILYDLNSSPTNPPEIGEFDSWYVHDSYARGDTLYLAHINDGFFTITDVSNPASINLMSGQINTPMNFTHNCWLSADAKYLFTTDEVSGAWIAAYDISDFSNITEVDRIRRSETSGVIPHNTYWLNNYLVTSYYRDGITIHDVTNPSNMIEVGNFDTTPLSGDGFNGAWGVYPFFASGNLIVSDIELGLFILGPTYVRACYLQGNVTDAVSLANINDARIEILTTPNFDNSDLTGFYSTGVSSAGSYQVVYSKAGYYNDTVTVNLTPGNTDTVNIALTPLPITTLTGTITNSITSSGINNVIVQIENSMYTYTTTTNSSGVFLISPFYVDSENNYFNITIGTWGYNTYCADSVLLNDTTGNLDISLVQGFYDDFTLDFGWTNSATSSFGIWTREEPFGTILGTGFSNPEYDVSFDCGDKAYITGNTNSASVGADDIDGGYCMLTSPVFNTTGLSDAYISCYLWFTNGGGSGTPNDTLSIYINDGSSHLIEKLHINNFTIQNWNAKSYKISDYTSSTTNLQFIIKAQDYPSGHIVESGIDLFKVTDGNPFSGIENTHNANNKIKIYPNPVQDNLIISSFEIISKLEILDLSGKLLFSEFCNSNFGNLNFESYQKGIYFVKTITSEGITYVNKVIKE